MRCDHHRRSGYVANIRLNFDAAMAKFVQDRVVVDQVTQDSDRTGLGLFQRKCDRIAYTEAHAQMFSSDDFHFWSYFLNQYTLRYKV